MGAEVLVLVTCTNRKTVPPAPALSLRAIPGRTPAARVKVWLKRMRAAPGTSVSAEALYAGDHWHVVRSIQNDATRAKRQISVWVCSAGYGLIPLCAEIVSYAATFTSNHPDSVTRAVDNRQARRTRREWWGALATWSGPEPGAPRTIYELAREHKNSTLLLAASPQYLDAVADDLGRAATVLSPGRVCIFCAGADSRPCPQLDAFLVPCSARLQEALGGALNSLNTRCVRYALRHAGEDGLQLPALRTFFARLLRKQPKRQAPQRTPLSDEEVYRFIQTALGKDSTIRPTPLLFRLREGGLACGQSRFCALFRRVEGGLHG